jgi:hypothetical protein
VDPKTQTVSDYRSRSEVLVLGKSEMLGGGAVLPGFQLPVSEIFAG